MRLNYLQSARTERRGRRLPSLIVCALLLFSCFFSTASFAADSSSPLQVYLFASSTCSGCKELKERLLPLIRERFGSTVVVSHVPVDDVEQFKLQLAYEKLYGVQDDEALKVFVGKKCLFGEKAIWDGLEGAIAREIQSGSVTPTPGEVLASTVAAGADAQANSEALAAERFSRFKIAGVALAGLVDGINPCAFTTLIFFVSLLAALKKGKREILLVGACFAFAVFATYLALGLGAMKAVKVFSVGSGLSKVLTLGVAGFSVCLSGASFHDYLKYRRSRDGSDLTLKLPDRIRNRIRTIMSRQMRTRSLVIGALSLGVVVSLLESLCTGQVYLPTILCVTRDRDLAGRAVACLFLYNVMFILPLLGVFALAYYGITSEKMAAFSRKHLGWTKLLLAMLFAGLGVTLIVTTF